MKVLIYLETQALDLNELDKLPAPPTITRDLDFYIEASAQVKIAVVEWHYYHSIVPLRNTLERVKDTSDAVVIRSVEGFGTFIKLMQDNDLMNFHYFIGFIPNFKLAQASWKFNTYWIGDTTKNYTDHLNNYRVDNRYNSSSNKPYMFEVLYGQPKAHRSFTKDYINNDPRFLESAYLTSSSVEHSAMGDQQSIFWEEDIIREHNGMVTFMGKEMRLSQTIPFKVYNSCLYSLVCETWTDNEYSFFTEKITKPMIVGRLFIPVTGQYFLRNLRELGFKTFDGIIDESFDEIADHQTRWSAAIDEAKKLCDKDPAEVLEQARPIIAHNRERLLFFKDNIFEIEEFLKEFADKKLGF